MIKHSVRPFVVAVLLCFSLSYSLTSSADDANTLPVTIVTTADYQIGAEGLPDSRQRSKSRAVTASGAQTKRQLVSLYGGESGDRIPERGYLTDVVWGEKTTYPAAAADVQAITHERILYYSFNIGRWKRKLNSETSVLTRAFMTQPLLVFLFDQDKATLAAQLVTTPLFKQAVTMHKQQVIDPTRINSPLLNDLIAALGEQGVTNISTAQQQISTQSLQAEITRQAKSLRSTKPISPNLTFTDSSPEFNVFDGLSVSGNKASQLNFDSYSALYYGIQPLSEFKNTKGGFWTNVGRHFTNVPLIEPVSGWLDKDAIKDYVTTWGEDAAYSKPTPLELAAISDQLTEDHLNQPVNVAIFRNNPYVLFDAPQSMNIMTAVAMITKVTGQAAAVFKPKLAKDLMANLQTVLKKTKAFQEWFGLTYSVVSAGQQLLCTLQEQHEGICGDALQKIEKLAKMLPDAIGTVDTLLKKEAASKNPDAFTSKTSTYCSTGLALDLAASFFAPIEAVNDGSKKFRFTLCTLDKVFTQPLLAMVETVLPDDYAKLDYHKYNSVHLTADYLARTRGWPAFVKPVTANMRLESLTAKLFIKKSIDVKGILTSSIVAMQSVTDATKFLQDVANNKVEMQPLVVHLWQGLQAYLVKSGQTMLADLAYDTLMALTPGKYLQLAYTIGNDGSKLAWDWMTDPAVIKLTMTRTQKTDPDTKAVTDMLNLSNTLPDMKGIRYLTIPIEDAAAFPIKPAKVLDYSDGVKDAGSMGSDRLLAVSSAADTNHLLVYSDFQASVENQSAYPVEDNDRVKQLLKDGKISLRWHVKRFNKAADIAVLPYTERNAGNAFNGSNNDIDTPVKKGWTWWTDPIISLKNSKNPLQQPAVLGDAQTKFYALDFTEVYRNQVGDTQAYPLKHKTPGIYSDYTHIQVKDGAAETLFQNTFNIYVLPNLNAVTAPGSQTQINLNGSLKKSSRIYCEEDTCTKNGELQLNFANSPVWDQIGRNGLWAVWMQADGIMASEPIAVRTTAGGTVTSTLRIPEDININADYLIIYEDVMNAYLQHSGRAKVEVLRTAFMQRIRANNRRYPVIALNLKELKDTVPTFTPLLKPVDSDNDGVPDTLDAFPNNPQYSYDTDADTMPDEWENQYGLDIFTDDSPLDLDNDGISNLDEFKGGTDPAFLPLTLTGVTGDKQVALTWNPIKEAAYVLCYATETIGDVNNCLNYAGGKLVNVTGSGTQYTVKGLTNGKNYYFRVNAENNVQTLAISNLLTATPGKAYGLNDTGISAAQCYQLDSNALVACTGEAAQALNKKQDGMMGRDLTQNNSSDGHLGFSFTKISATGAALPVTAGSWACVKDNVTGLLWENKTADGGLHDGSHRYTNYSADYGSGNLGAASDASGFVAAVNQQGLCGASNWRLPSADELQSIVDYGVAYPGPTIDSAFFPNTQNYAFWSSSPYVGGADYAWGVYFGDGNVYGSGRGLSFAVRLVRASQ